MSRYGGSILGMVGADSVVLATDKRIGAGYQTLGMNYTKVS